MYFFLFLKLCFMVWFICMCFRLNIRVLCIVKLYILISVELFFLDYIYYFEISYKCLEYDSFFELC